jgi:uncharacterized protein involved in response to NO
MRDTSSVLPSIEMTRHEPFGRVVPLLKAALLLGIGGFLLTTVLTLTDALSLPLNPWWTALAQAHGHLQLYGWATLFVVGLALHFLPRLRGVPLVAAWLIPWIVIVQVVALLLRTLSQPLLVVTGTTFWRILLVLSGLLECIALGTAVLLFTLMALRSPLLATRRMFKGSIPFLGGAFAALALAALVNLGNVVQAASGNGLVEGQGDALNVTLGLLGFLVPVALAMSARALPSYSDSKGFSQQALWFLSTAYFVGLALTFIGMSWAASFPWLSVMSGFGMLLLGIVIFTFSVIFLRLMNSRRLQYGESAQNGTQAAQMKIASERNTYGPFVRLIISAYLWAALGALLLASDGVASLLGIAPFFALDAMRHSFAPGFVALLLAGVSARMLPGFSGRKIAGSVWVTALFWLGNTAVLLRIGPLLLLPVLVAWGNVGLTLYTLLFGLSGPIGLAFALCLALNLWPALQST